MKNKKGQGFSIVGILIVLFILWLLFVKPIQDERDFYKDKYELTLSEFNEVKKRYNIRVQELLNTNSELREEINLLNSEVNKYKTEVSIFQSKIQIPFTNIVLKFYWYGLSFSVFFLITMHFLKIEFNVDLSQIKKSQRFFIIWSIYILNVVLLVTSSIAFVIDSKLLW